MPTFHISRFTPFIYLSLSLILLNLGCSQETEQAQILWDVTFLPLGAQVRFEADSREPIERVRAFDSDEAIVAQLDLGGYPRRAESLYFRWEKGGMYRFEVTAGSGRLTSKTVQAPQVDSQGSIEIAIPYGTVEAEAEALNAKSLVLQGSEMTATILVRNGLTASVTFQVELRVPSEIQVLRLPPVWRRDEAAQDDTLIYRTSGKLTVEAEVWYSQLRLKIPDQPLSTSTQLSGRVVFEGGSGSQWERQTYLMLRSATVDEIATQLSIERVLMPTDVAGVSDPRQRPDAISYPRPLFGGLGRWLGAKGGEVNYFQPITYQTVRIRNSGQETIHAVIASVNRHPESGEAIPFLAPPDMINAGTNRSLALVSLAGERTTDVPLPLYFNPPHLGQAPDDLVGLTGAGRYEREIEVKVWGSDATVLQTTRPLRIVTPNRHALFVTAVAFIATVFGIFALISLHQQIFSSFSTKQLILIALFGATIFVAVSVPSTLLANLVSALLGPIAFLITGLINEMLYYALLTSLLMLAPKSGVITLVSAVRLMLGGVTLGLLTPMALLYTGVTVLLLEAGFRLTRNRASIAIWAGIFGVCDALAVYVDFQLSITLYRLFYADWYILTRLLVDGFSYTFIGVLLGRQLGRGLWRVAE
jgi:hypothetical protein